MCIRDREEEAAVGSHRSGVPSPRLFLSFFVFFFFSLWQTKGVVKRAFGFSFVRCLFLCEIFRYFFRLGFKPLMVEKISPPHQTRNCERFKFPRECVPFWERRRFFSHPHSFKTIRNSERCVVKKNSLHSPVRTELQSKLEIFVLRFFFAIFSKKLLHVSVD